MLEEGLPADSIKTALKLSRTTFFQGKRAYQGHGAEGLKVWPIPGGTPKLTDQQTSQLFGWLAGRDPRQFQFDFGLWTRRIGRDLILQKFGVEMTLQGIGKLLRRIGLSRSGRCTAPTSKTLRRCAGGRRSSSRRSGAGPRRGC